MGPTCLAGGSERGRGTRVLRGASFNNDNPDNLLSSNRNNNSPDNRNDNIGFRVVVGVGASSRKVPGYRSTGSLPDAGRETLLSGPCQAVT